MATVKSTPVGTGSKGKGSEVGEVGMKGKQQWDKVRGSTSMREAVCSPGSGIIY